MSGYESDESMHSDDGASAIVPCVSWIGSANRVRSRPISQAALVRATERALGAQPVDMEAEESAAQSASDPFAMDKYDIETSLSTFATASGRVGDGYDIEDQQVADDEHDDSSVGSDEEDFPLGDTVDPSELDDLVLRPDDCLVVVGRVAQDDWFCVDVNVLEAGESTPYVHHDYVIPSFPLDMEWIGFGVGTEDQEAAAVDGPPSFLAVATFDVGIEVWNVDVIDAVEPAYQLGGQIDLEEEALVAELGDGAVDEAAAAAAAARAVARKLRDGKSSSSAMAAADEDDQRARAAFARQRAATEAGSMTLADGSHTDAVLSIAWNRQAPNMFLSGSADNTVKLWDLTRRSQSPPMHTYTHHRSKVQAVGWCPAQASVFASGSFDRSLVVIDARTANDGLSFALPADVEAVSWNPYKPNQLVASVEDGRVMAFDVAAGPGSGPLMQWQASAAGAPVSGLTFHATMPNLMATASIDQTVQLWSLRGEKPANLFDRDLGTPLFSASFCPDAPSQHKLAVVGKGTFQLLDVSDTVARLEATA
mmetsp:Transcript_3181/g.10465  ORF Transcript_3181/g.10465 Transcript_3181/m.10465 type:complete len:537 (-) Transcript_3181:87-1697(-)